MKFGENLGGIIDTNTLISGFTIQKGQSNNYGGGIYIKDCSPSFLNVTITECAANFNGGGFYIRSGSPNITEVDIINNSANRGSGIYCQDYAHPQLTDVKISGNIAGNQGGGFGCYNYCNPKLKNVLISDNIADEGGGIYSFYCYAPGAILSNVTIVSNTGSFGGGIYCKRSGINLVNSILWNNSPQEVYFSDLANSNSIMITYSSIQGGENEIVVNDNGTVYWLEGNIESDPLFVEPENDIYILQQGSPCIDSGTAFFVWEGDTLVNMSNNEYFGSAPDMGVYEYEGMFISNLTHEIPRKFTLHQNYPNPFNPVTNIRYDLPKDSDVFLAVYDLLGREVAVLVSGNMVSGAHDVVWNGTDKFNNPVSAGVYIYRINTAGFNEVKKLILLK